VNLVDLLGASGVCADDDMLINASRKMLELLISRTNRLAVEVLGERRDITAGYLLGSCTGYRRQVALHFAIHMQLTIVPLKPIEYRFR